MAKEAEQRERLGPGDGPTPLRTVRAVGFAGDDVALAQALKRGDPGAPAALFDRYAAHIERVLANVMGIDHELADLLHETFAHAFKSIGSLHDEARLKGWLTSIAVFTARGCIRARSRRSWLRLAGREEVLPEPVAHAVPAETREAVRCTYAVLARLDADLRIAFTLRVIDGMELTEVAEACKVSLATIKRWLARAEKKFMALAAHEPALSSWVEAS